MILKFKMLKLTSEAIFNELNIKRDHPPLNISFTMDQPVNILI